MPRKPREASSLNIYHIVIRGADRQVIFEEEDDYLKYLDFLSFYKNKYRFEIYAFCLMNNHVHLVIYTPFASLETIFRSLNSRYNAWYNRKYDRTGFLQEGRYYSEPINSMPSFLRCVRYVHLNPFRAGLETVPGEKYPWSSYHEYSKGISNLIDSSLVRELCGNRKIFIEFHSQPEIDSDFLDINTIKKRLSDENAKQIIFQISGCKNATEFQKLSLENKEKHISSIHKAGVSIRQLNRLTGTPRGIIVRICSSR